VTRAAAVALAFLIFAASVPAASGEETLRVCLDAKVPPWSFHNGRQSGGFDAAVADAVARRLGRKLTLRWFETTLDESFSTPSAANALLSDGVCQLVGGYPLFESALGEPGTKSARLPDYEGAKPGDRRRWVDLGILAPSRGYQFAAQTIVLGPAAASARRAWSWAPTASSSAEPWLDLSAVPSSAVRSSAVGRGSRSHSRGSLDPAWCCSARRSCWAVC